MSKIISVSLPGSATVHGHALDGAYGATLCRPEPGKRAYVPTTEPETITCKSCAKIIRESALTVVDSAPEPVATVEAEPVNGVGRVLTSLRTARVYVDNSGNIYGAETIPGGAILATLRAGMARVNGASRVMLDNGRTGRRIVLTIAGRAALGI